MSRLREFDFIRAAAALSVIAIHITGIYVYSSRAAYAWNQAMRYAVPLFIVLSGLLLAYSDKHKQKTSYREFIVKRFNRIAIPYLAWSIIYMLFNLRGKYGEVLSDLPQFLKTLGRNIIYGTSELHLYFVIIIIQMYLLYPLLSKLLTRWKGTTLAATFCITFYFQSGVYLSCINVARILPELAIPHYESFLTWIFYFVFGMYAAGKIEEWKNRLLSAKKIPGLVWIASFALLYTDSVLTKTNAESIKPTVMLYCMASFFFFYTAALALKDTKSTWGTALDWLSKQSFMIYLSHILVQNILWALAGKLGMPGLWKGNAGMVLFFVATTSSTMLAVYLASYTPLAALLGGVPSKKGIITFKDNNKGAAA